MGLKSPAPIQSRLRHLQEKGYISWQEGRARTLQLVDNLVTKNIPILGSIAAGGLIESYSDVSEELDVTETLEKKGVFALTVNGDSMKDAYLIFVPPRSIKRAFLIFYLCNTFGTYDYRRLQR